MQSSVVAGFNMPQGTCQIRFHAAVAVTRVELLGLDSKFTQRCVSSALVVVDAGRSILDANQRARDLLSGEHGIEDVGGVLKFKRASVCRTVTQLVHQAARGDTGLDAAADVVGIPDDRGRTRFAVRVLPCLYLGDSGALVMVSDMLSEAHASQGILAKLFSLSTREAEFADHFASGSRVEQIASDMAISSNTARIHLRHLFLKTGCKTQAELARLLAKVPEF